MGLSKKNRYVACTDCGCRLEMNGVCKICGHEDVPPLPGMVPDLIGLDSEVAFLLIIHPEAQLITGEITETNSDTVPVNKVISSEPVAGTQLAIGAAVDMVVSLGPTG